jgi:hypothetical protein
MRRTSPCARTDPMKIDRTYEFRFYPMAGAGSPVVPDLLGHPVRPELDPFFPGRPSGTSREPVRVKLPKNRHLSKSVVDVSFSEFLGRASSPARPLVEADASACGAFPSSESCSRAAGLSAQNFLFSSGNGPAGTSGRLMTRMRMRLKNSHLRTCGSCLRRECQTSVRGLKPDREQSPVKREIQISRSEIRGIHPGGK